MTWMGAKADIAAITATDTAGLQDNIVFAATTELKFLMLNKTSTATVDNSTVWAATPAGRWLLAGGSGIASSSIEIVANLAALQALTSASQDKLYALDTTPPQLFSWDAASTATVSDDIVKLTALTTGRMYRIYPATSGSNTIVSFTAPSTVLASGTVYVWAENDTAAYPADSEGRYPNSLITYVSNGTVWLVTNAKKIVYGGSPLSIGKPPNDTDEKWTDTSTIPSTRYEAIISSTNGLDWEQI